MTGVGRVRGVSSQLVVNNGDGDDCDGDNDDVVDVDIDVAATTF